MFNFPDGLNKIKSAELELDYGFSIYKTKNNYRKKFLLNNFDKLNISLFLETNDFKLIKSFFNNDLKYSSENFIADFNLGHGEAEYSLLSNPQFKKIEADLYLLDLELLQKKKELDIICMNIVPCFRLIFKNMEGQNTLKENNIEATIECKQTNLCFQNQINLMIGGINEYSKKTIFI